MYLCVCVYVYKHMCINICVYKSPTLTAVNTVIRGQLRDASSSISNLDDLTKIDYNNNTNIDDLSDDLKRKTKQEKITQIKDFLKSLDIKTREEIEKNLNESGWLNKLITDQLIDPKICEHLKRKRLLGRIDKGKAKQQNTDVVVLHPRDRLKRRKTNAIRSRTNFPMIDLTKAPSTKYLKKLIRTTKKRKGTEKDKTSGKVIALEPPNEPDIQLKFEGRKSSYLKYPKMIASEEFLKEVPEFNFRIKVNKRDKIKAREEIFDKIIKQIPDNDKYFINYDPATDSYLIDRDKKIIEISDDVGDRSKK